MSADAALIILGGHTDSQICTALQGRPEVRFRLQRILRWDPPPSQQSGQQPSQQSTRQRSNASAQQVPWPGGSKPAMSDPISSQAQFGGAPAQQAQQAPQHWGQQGSSDSRNWYDVTEQEQQASTSHTMTGAQAPRVATLRRSRQTLAKAKAKASTPAHSNSHSSTRVGVGRPSAFEKRGLLRWKLPPVPLVDADLETCLVLQPQTEREAAEWAALREAAGSAPPRLAGHERTDAGALPEDTALPGMGENLLQRLLLAQTQMLAQLASSQPKSLLLEAALGTDTAKGEGSLTGKGSAARDAYIRLIIRLWLCRSGGWHPRSLA